MPDATPTAVLLRSATFTLDGTDYSCQLVDVTLTAEPNTKDDGRIALCGAAIPASRTYSHTLTGTAIQDWPAPGGGLIGYTRQDANAGTVVPFTLTSVDPAGLEITGTVQIDPLDLSLNPNATAESGVSWKIISKTETYPDATPPAGS